jgi:hypothetical protein
MAGYGGHKKTDPGGGAANCREMTQGNHPLLPRFRCLLKNLDYPENRSYRQKTFVPQVRRLPLARAFAHIPGVRHD